MGARKHATLFGFVDEMEKISATVQELLAGVKRLGIVRAPRVSSANKVMEDLFSIQLGMPQEYGTVQKLISSGGAATSVPKKISELERAKTENAFRAFARRKGYSSAEIEDAFQYARDRKAGLTSSDNRSYILLGRGAYNPGSMAGREHSWGGDARKAYNAIVAHHEGFERAALKGKIDPGYGHKSPDVLMKEHNLLSRITGPGSEEARSALVSDRNTMGDSKALSDSLVERFGPRARLEYGYGQKIPKAMRKALLKRVPEQWSSFPDELLSSKAPT